MFNTTLTNKCTDIALRFIFIRIFASNIKTLQYGFKNKRSN